MYIYVKQCWKFYPALGTSVHRYYDLPPTVSGRQLTGLRFIIKEMRAIRKVIGNRCKGAVGPQLSIDHDFNI